MAIFNFATQEHLPNALALVARRMNPLLLGVPGRPARVAMPRIRGWLTCSLLIMRAIRRTPLRLSTKLGGELRLYAACRILEFSFSPGRVSQHGVQPLWSQDHESEHKHEKDLRAETHDSLLDQSLVVGNDGGCADWLLFLSFHR